MKTLFKAITGCVLLVLGFYAAGLEFNNINLLAALVGIISGSILLSCALTDVITAGD